MSFGITVKNIRTRAGMTQVEFAKAIHVSQNAVSQYESGSRIPSMHIVKQIISVAKEHKIKVKIEDFLGDEE